MVHDLEKIEQKIDRVAAGAIPISESVGGIAITSFGELMEFAKVISLGGVAVRKHFRGNPGAVITVTLQALEWRMSPIQVMNKSYEVNDQLAYEAQLIHAVVEARAPLTKRLDFEFSGEGINRRCVVSGDLKGEPKPKVYESPPLAQIKGKSPLWTQDPDQQLSYYSSRAWARRYVPDVLMGIYAKDELEDGATIDVTPTTPTVGERLRENKAKRAEGFNQQKITHQMSEVVPDKIIERDVANETRAAAAASTRDVSRTSQQPPEKPRETSGPVAQMDEHRNSTPTVAGSNPAGPAINSDAIEIEYPDGTVKTVDKDGKVVEAQGSSVAASTAPPAEAKPKKRQSKPKAEPAKAAKEVVMSGGVDEHGAIEEALHRGRRLLAGLKTDEDIADLCFSITDELKEAGALGKTIQEWRDECDAKRQGAK